MVLILLNWNEKKVSNGSASLAIVVIVLFYLFAIILDVITYRASHEEINQNRSKFVTKKANNNKYFKPPKVKRINVKPSFPIKSNPKRYYTIKF